VNAALPKKKKIRAISLSIGWNPQQHGYDEVMAAVERAKNEGVFVISMSLRQSYGFSMHGMGGLALQGLGRGPLADPNSFASFGPSTIWSKWFWDGKMHPLPGEQLLVPIDSRCLASPTGPGDYAFGPLGGVSWCEPWLAGLYALVCQVKPEITPEEFWTQALKTGETIRLRNNDTPMEFGTIPNPLALIESLQQAK
jgi:hypothetical protein